MNKYFYNTLKWFIYAILLTILIPGWIVSAECMERPVAGVHTLNATDSLQKIDVEVFYYIPQDRTALEDWRHRIDSLMLRAQKFHNREFTGQSRFTYRIAPEPFIASATQGGLPQDDVNKFYWHIMNEVWHSGQVEFEEGSFPIILVFSDNNFSPSYDDWTRECNGEGCLFPEPHTDCAGYVKSNGEDRPGSRCGGSRSVFWPQKHIGLGLVTADGWRVPLKGSDCVVYHEGIGHSIGLPHPEPINNSVMGLAQYVDGIHVAWIDDDQKVSLGWKREPIDRTSLFSTFQVSHSPSHPSALQPVQIMATFPLRYNEFEIVAEIQNNLREPFQRLNASVVWKQDGLFNYVWTVRPVNQGQSIAYRVRIETAGGEKEEIWNYYKVR